MPLPQKIETGIHFQENPPSVLFLRDSIESARSVRINIMGLGLFRQTEVTAQSAAQDKQVLFAQWALPHKDYIYTACFYLTRRHEEADDLFQETYLRAFRFFHQFTPGTNCRAWLLTIMHNAFRTRLAQHRHEVPSSDFDTTLRNYEQRCLQNGTLSEDDPSLALLARTLDTEIRDALLALSEENRIVLLLVDIEEMTYDEAAAVLECPIGTIRSRLSRARQFLRDQLTSYAHKHSDHKRQRFYNKKG